MRNSIVDLAVHDCLCMLDDAERVMWLLVHGSHYRLVYPQQQMLVMDSEGGQHYSLVPHGERCKSGYMSLLCVVAGN